LTHGLHNIVAGLEPIGRPELAPVVAQHIAAKAAAAQAAAVAGKPSVQHVTSALAGGGVVIATIATVGLLLSAQRSPTPQAAPAAQTPASSVGPQSPVGVVVYGGDLSDPQHAELQQLFGLAASGLPTDTITRPELVGALQSAGLPVDGSERAISSALEAGNHSMLRVRPLQP
jgi:hypothetical protein